MLNYLGNAHQQKCGTHDTTLTPIPSDAGEHPPVLDDEGDVLNVGHGLPLKIEMKRQRQRSFFTSERKYDGPTKDGRALPQQNRNRHKPTFGLEGEIQRVAIQISPTYRRNPFKK